MKVSVLMLTYNHVDFIAQAIECVLMQQTGFDYELVIGEDYSTDGTREICIDYQNQYPDIIRVLSREKNLGPSSNYVDALKNCKGEYIAHCEGDDYWTNPLKLQKQVDLLENHSDCCICFTDAIVAWEDGSREPYACCRPNQKEISTLEDIIQKCFIPACTVMFRRGLFGEFPAWFYEVVNGDWALHILNAQYGNIIYLNEPTCVYRVHSQGIWSQQSREQVFHHATKFLDIIDQHFDYHYHSIINTSKTYWYYDLAVYYEEQNDIPNAREALRKCATIHPLSPELSRVRLLWRILRLKLKS